MALFTLALPGPIAAALWWRNGLETRNVSLEAGSAEFADLSKVEKLKGVFAT
jgi:hypothetical protein